MGYFLQAFISKSGDVVHFAEAFDRSIVIEIGQGLSMIPMTASLFDQIDKASGSQCIEGFDFMTESVETSILKFIGNTRFSYIEAEYHGGQGGQTGITWMFNKRQHIFPFGQDAINLTLRSYGVVANRNQDEFDTLGLGLFRDTDDWVDNYKTN